MTERKQKYDPFTGKGEIEVKDTPYKGLKRFIIEPKTAATITLSRPKQKR